MPVLTGIDTLGIQRYIAASNRLRDVLAASWMVDHVTSTDGLCRFGLEKDRVLLAAAGNAIVEFDSKPAARAWAAGYTRWLDEHAPGLEVVLAHRTYVTGSLTTALGALAVDLARSKLERVPSAPQLGLSVTAACSITGLPATDRDRHDGDLLAPQVTVLRSDETQSRAKARWRRFLPPALRQAGAWQADFPDELDLLGRTHGRSSRVGLVHVDGNGVGKEIKDWLERCRAVSTDDHEVRCQYRQWSDAIARLGRSVLRAVIERVASCVHEQEDESGRRRCFLRGSPADLAFRLCDARSEAASGSQQARKASADTVFLPIRPILLGGDDLIFACDGRIALDLAVAALEAFGDHAIPHLGATGEGKVLTACAGVALVNSHAPFHRSYDLAYGLCTSAKRRRHVATREGSADNGCWLDWHLGTTRPGERVASIRARHYQRGDEALTMRPYPVGHADSEAPSWRWLEEHILGPGSAASNALRGFREPGKNAGRTVPVPNAWAGSRNRVKRLASLVVDGRDAVERQIGAWKAIEPDLALPEGSLAEGQTALLDAIELMDLHLRLQPDPSEPGASSAEREPHSPASTEKPS